MPTGECTVDPSPIGYPSGARWASFFLVRHLAPGESVEAAGRRFVTEWYVVQRARGSGMLEERFTFVTGCPVRFFADSVGELGVRGTLPSPIPRLLWWEVGADMQTARHLFSRPR